jgi:lysophospholipase L1-like esterase
MSATNGSAVSFRRLIGCCMALALVASALLASSASAAKAPLKPTAYVALGDSISFGYKEETFDLNYPTESPAAFEPGFVGIVGKKLAAPEKKAGNSLTTVNLGCPGETSGGLIGNGPLGTALEEQRASKSEAPLKVSAPCAYHNVDGFTLKTEQGGASELEYAVGMLESGVEIKAVTLNIGSNDELETVGKCENPSYDAEQGYTGGLFECITKEAGLEGHEYPGGLFTHIITNVGTAIGVLRNYGYTGPVSVLGFYNPQAEILPGSDALQLKLNEAFEGEIGGGAFGPGVVYANPFPVFNPQKAKAEKADICKFTEECNANDKKVNFEKYLEGKGYSHAEAEAIATPEASESYPEGDIHPTALGYKKLASLVLKAGI